MDPYLESCWGDVHTSLITYARDQLRVQLPADLRVRVEEQVALEGELEEPTERAFRITDARSGNRVVTAIEFLSPVNKSEPVGSAAYRRKQADLREARVNLVEIDLPREAVCPGG